MKEAAVWVMPLATSGKIPQLPQIERLATQLLAILIASEPKDQARQNRSISETIHELKW